MKRCFFFVVAMLVFQIGEQLRSADDVSSPSFASVKAEAEKGDASAQLKPGMFYYQGKVVPQDQKNAYVWLRKAADQTI